MLKIQYNKTEYLVDEATIGVHIEDDGTPMYWCGTFDYILGKWRLEYPDRFITMVAYIVLRLESLADDIDNSIYTITNNCAHSIELQCKIPELQELCQKQSNLRTAAWRWRELTKGKK